MKFPFWSFAFIMVLQAVALADAPRIVLVAGGTQAATGIPAVEARLYEPFGVEFDSRGTLYVIEMVAGNRLLKIDREGLLIHVAGRREPGFAGDGGPALLAQFNGPHNLAVLPGGDILLSDTWNGRVRRVDPVRGSVSTEPGFVVPLDRARAAGPYQISLHGDGTRLLVCDLRQVHEVDLTTGASRVLAGNGQKGKPVDGAYALESPLVDPRAAVMDREGRLYILERNGHALRRVERDGRIHTVVNAAGLKGSHGDGGEARMATLNGPKHLCLDHDGSVLIADAENHLIRRYRPATETIERVAGTGRAGTAGVGGPPEACELNRPHGVTVHQDGSLYITDSYNHRILRIVR